MNSHAAKPQGATPGHTAEPHQDKVSSYETEVALLNGMQDSLKPPGEVALLENLVVLVQSDIGET